MRCEVCKKKEPGKLYFIFLICLVMLSQTAGVSHAGKEGEFVTFESIRIRRPLTDEKIDKALKAYLKKDKQLTPGQILKIADIHRGPDQPFELINTLVEYDDGEKVAKQKIKVNIHLKGQKDEEIKSLVKILSPSHSRGNLLLNTGDEVWFYSKGTRRPLRISKQQRLMGQVSNGDVLNVNFRNDYTPQEMQMVDVDGQSYYLLKLNAKNRSVTYDKIEYWIRKDNFYPYKANFYAISGRMLKTAFYKDYQVFLKVSRCSRVVIHDAIKKNAYSVIHYDDFAFSELPEKHFQKNYLKFIR